ncbi:MAG: MFS transporter [Clostridia bacterium]|nr:MFS transporter [Clostridia bacterium]
MDSTRKPTPLGGRVWFSAIFFGLVGQIAWVVENMYFATLSQDIFANSGRNDLAYIVTTLMVIFSALSATVTTVFAGGLCDKVGKRRPFIAYGYIAWGFTIMGFGFIPMRAEGAMLTLVAVLLVVFDCLMTFCGSTANDAAFNAWVADVTDTSNRGKVNAILSMLPVFAVVIIFLGLGSLYNANNETNLIFFLVLGAIPIIAGVMARFLLKDSAEIEKSTGENYWRDTFYGFSPRVIKENKMMYVCLLAACLVGIAQQTFFSYLINFVIRTLNYGDSFVVPMAVIIVGAAVVTGVRGVLSDKWGRKRFYLPLLVGVVLGTLSMYLLQFISGGARDAVLFVGGIVMMGAILALTGALTASFQDYIPKGYEGRFQGVRMFFVVLIPMIVGPIISMCIGLDAMGMNGADFTPTYTIFLAASIVAVFALFPLLLVRKDADRLQGK